MNRDNRNKYQTFIYWGVTALLVLSGIVLLVFLLIKFDRVLAAGQMLMGILAPILYGAVCAYLLAPVYNWVRQVVEKASSRVITSPERRRALGSFAATIVSVVMWILEIGRAHV